MRTFALPTGHTVITKRLPGTPVIEFTTTNRNGDVISTVRHSFAESVPLLRTLACRTA
ncbi:hypothetical protein ACIRO1_36495 [Streptomyces sp. NPDC102381]|uniref:hypothetical protein n=1 Tax=Streptomyces sp. NPDC102381 TaxID=3366164 RepID=UPI0037FCE890